MNAFTPVSKAEFLRYLETRSDERFEYEGGFIVQQMAGRTRRHGEIGLRIAAALAAQLDGSNFVVTPERGVDTPTSIRFADVVVQPADEPDDSVTTSRPVIVVEVLSPSSRGLDLRVKAGEYLGLASLDAYIVASQTEPAMRVWTRDDAGAFPETPLEIEGCDAVVEVNGRELSVKIALGDAYAGLAGT